MDESLLDQVLSQSEALTRSLFEQSRGLLEGLGIISLLGGVPGVLFLLFFIVIPLAVALYDLLQRQHAIRRNFPLIGILRYTLEKVGPELRQYIFTDDRGDRPIEEIKPRAVKEAAG